MLREDAYLLAIVHALPDPVVGIDSEGRVRAWNASAQRAFGASEDDAFGARVVELLGLDAKALAKNAASPRDAHPLKTRAGIALKAFVENISLDGLGAQPSSGEGNAVVSLFVVRPLIDGSGDAGIADPERLTDVLAPHADDLPPRLMKTLAALCEGLSEKQIAARLGLSPHTVHGYVKTLYRRFAVQSRGELAARVLLRPSSSSS
ncbi:MAG TPA: LuxR C-terminal-related transcriptional regulator [Myxococcota bacterium]